MKIEDIPNAPSWLVGATTHNADVTIDDCGRVSWHGGEFMYGEFSGGKFLGGEFSGGTFLDGEFSGGTFLDGNFLGGELFGAPFVASASVRGTGHGECGRTLHAIQTTEATYYRCGCFWGSHKELVAYIDVGHLSHTASRRTALDCVDRMLYLNLRRKD